MVLASASPRRHELLTLIGIAHSVRPADIDETIYPGEVPAAHPERLARQKAAEVAAVEPGALIIAADTIVVIDGEILGKPRDVPDAQRMLSALSGRSHTVYTAVAVSYGDRLESDTEGVSVTFRAIEPAEIDAYIATGEPMDKAGSYGIQGFGATIVDRIDGDYFAVMGLAIGRMVRLMRRVGVRYEFGRLTTPA